MNNKVKEKGFWLTAVFNLGGVSSRNDSKADSLHVCRFVGVLVLLTPVLRLDWSLWKPESQGTFVDGHGSSKLEQ